MNDQTPSSSETSGQSGAPSPAADADGRRGGGSGARAPWRRRFWLAGGLAAAAVALAACSHAGPGGMGGFGGGPGWGHHGRGPMTPEQMSQRIDRGVDRMLGDVGATDEQKRKVADIAKAAATELAPLRDKHRAARRQAMELMAAPTIDRPALERLRAEQLQLADTASRRITQAMADAAEVLTPEQRAKLKERMDRRMRRD